MTPLTPYRNHRNTIFSEFRDIFGDIFPQNFTPTIDITETATEYILTGDFPGLETKDLSIELSDNTLTIAGEKSSTKNANTKTHRQERSFGKFRRIFTFPDDIDDNTACAQMKNGVLTVHVPKSARSIKGAKRLEIKDN